MLDGCNRIPNLLRAEAYYYVSWLILQLTCFLTLNRLQSLMVGRKTNNRSNRIELLKLYWCFNEIDTLFTSLWMTLTESVKTFPKRIANHFFRFLFLTRTHTHTHTQYLYLSLSYSHTDNKYLGKIQSHHAFSRVQSQCETKKKLFTISWMDVVG